MRRLQPYFIIFAALFFSSCAKDTLGVNDPGLGTGNGNGPGIIIKRSTQETFYAKKYSGIKNKSSNASIEGGGIFNLSYQDIFFDEADGNTGDTLRAVRERNLLLVEISMVYQNMNKGGIQDFGLLTEVKFNNIALLSEQSQSESSSQRGFFKRNFAFTRNSDGTFTGAPGYIGSTELYDPVMMDFMYTQPTITVEKSDTVENLSKLVSIGSAIVFDSGKVIPSTNDMIIRLNRRISKGSVISFEKLRGPTSPYPYLPSIITYELLNDTNVIRIPKDEVTFIIETLRSSTGIAKPFGTLYPFWLDIIESGVCDTLHLMHKGTGKQFDFPVYQYFEFGRKMYFK